jgi:hypothetical protein
VIVAFLQGVQVSEALPLKKKLMKKKLVLSVIAIAFFVSDNFAQKKEFAWLIGTWKLKDKNIIERWELADDGKSLTGVSMKMNGNESTLLEETKLVFSGNSFYYVADVAGDQDPVDFQISVYDETSFVAENPEHDFPKAVRYRYIVRDNKEFLEAAIEGDGKVIPYTFEKIR